MVTLHHSAEIGGDSGGGDCGEGLRRAGAPLPRRFAWRVVADAYRRRRAARLAAPAAGHQQGETGAAGWRAARAVRRVGSFHALARGTGAAPLSTGGSRGAR